MTGLRARRTNEGYILVAVLGIMLLLTGFMAAGTMLVRSAIHGAVVETEGVALVGLTRGGLEVTAYQLFVRKTAPGAVDGRKIRFAGGTIVPHVVDEAGKVDLNGADPKLLESLFESVGIDRGAATTLTGRIVALRGADRGAPSAQPSAAKPADGQVAPAPSAPTPHRRGYQSVDQLRETPDLSRSDFKRLAPLLTVFNPDGKVDVMTAPEAVLAALPGLTRPDLALLLAHRRDSAPDAILALVQNAGPYVKTTPGPAYTVRIDAAAAAGQHGVLEAVVAMSRSPKMPYLVLDWREGA